MRAISAVTEVNVPRRMACRGDDPEPDLDLVEPARTDRGEMERDVRVALQPGGDVRGGVRGQVVQYYVDFLARVRLDRLAQERQEPFAGAVGRQAAVTCRVPTSRAANRLVVPCRL